PARSTPNRHTGYCRILGIMSATRAPFASPRPCRKAPKAADCDSSSAKVIDLPMHVYAGRGPNSATVRSKTSRTDAYALTSISAATSFGYDFNQILSTLSLREARPVAYRFWALMLAEDQWSGLAA